MVYTLGMKYVFIVIIGVLLAGCSIQFKTKELELDAKPAQPTVEWSLAEIGIDPIDYLKNGD